MSVGITVSDDHLKNFIVVTDRLSAEYAKELEGWSESPFAWILTLPSRTRGAVGEEIVTRWLSLNKFSVTRAPHSGCDRIVNGKKIEIKFSTLWKSGGYTFQQLRDQDYDFVFCLGISPQNVHAWLIPKQVAWEYAIPQHGGKDGKDTKWLSFQADSPPKWILPYGGTLGDVLELLKQMS